jgi:hypothetical protein
VPRLRLRQSFSRTLLAHAIWKKHTALAVHAQLNENQTKKLEQAPNKDVEDTRLTIMPTRHLHSTLAAAPDHSCITVSVFHSIFVTKNSMKNDSS